MPSEFAEVATRPRRRPHNETTIRVRGCSETLVGPSVADCARSVHSLPPAQFPAGAHARSRTKRSSNPAPSGGLLPGYVSKAGPLYSWGKERS